MRKRFFFGLWILVAPVLGSAEGGAEIQEEEKRLIVVEVAGEVEYPDVYKMPEGSRVWDALEEAGGVTQKADLMDINVAAVLLDATRLYVPAIPVGEERGSRVLTNRTPEATASAMNPPQYTRSGWLWLSATGRLEHGGEGSAGQAPKAGLEAHTGGLIDLNKAGRAELETLPGVGPATAAKIIAFREKSPFKRVEDLEQVPGIGSKKLEAVRHLVRVD